MHAEELQSSPSIIWMIKSGSMRWAGHVARTREKRHGFRVLVGKCQRRRQLWVDPCVSVQSGCCQNGNQPLCCI